MSAATRKQSREKSDNPTSLTGIETIKLGKRFPKATKNFAFLRKESEADGAFFQPTEPPIQFFPSWRIGINSGTLRFRLTLPERHGVVFILEPAAALVDGRAMSPATLHVNGNQWVDVLGNDTGNFAKYSWYLPAEDLKKGDNEIAVRLSEDARGQLLVRSASVMRVNVEKQRHTNWCWAAVITSLLKYFGTKRQKQCHTVLKCVGPVKAKKTGEIIDCCTQGGQRLCNEQFSLSQALSMMGMLKGFKGFDGLLDGKELIEDGRPNPAFDEEMGWLSHIPQDEHRERISAIRKLLIAGETGRLLLERIRRQINKGIPVPIRIGWPPRNKDGFFENGHFVILTGVSPDDKRGPGFTKIRVSDPWDGTSKYQTLDSLFHFGADRGVWTHIYFIKRPDPRRKQLPRRRTA